MRAGTSRLPYFSCPPVLVFPSTTPPSIVLSSRHQASWTYPPLPLSLPPSGGNTIAGLRDTYISGDLEFDPLGTYAGCGLRNSKAKNYHVEFREDEVAHPHEGWSNPSLCASCLSPAATCSSFSPRFVLFVSRPPLPSLFPPHVSQRRPGPHLGRERLHQQALQGIEQWSLGHACLGGDGGSGARDQLQDLLLSSANSAWEGWRERVGPHVGAKT